jgi:hypothetical protein
MIGDERKRLQAAINETLWPPVNDTWKLVYEAAQRYCNTLPKPQRREWCALVSAEVRKYPHSGDRTIEPGLWTYSLDTLGSVSLISKLRELVEHGATGIVATVRERWVDDE